MRTIRFTPGISRFWLMNPGILLYYDKIIISDKDYRNLSEDQNVSTFHYASYMFFEGLNKNYPNLFSVESYTPDIIYYDSKACDLIDFMFSEKKPFIEPKTILKVTIKKYQRWINFNKTKCLILNPKEEYRQVLEQDHIEKWEEYIKNIKRLNKYINSKDFYLRFKDVPSAIGSFTRLISTCLRFIDLNNRGIDLYDSTMSHYFEGINLTKKTLSILENIPYKGNIELLYNIAPSSSENFISVNQFTLKDFLTKRKECKKIRSQLEEVDQIIKNLNNNSLKKASKYNQEIYKIINDIKKQLKQLEIVFYLSSFISPISAFLIPNLTQEIKENQIAYYIYKKNLGKLFTPYISTYGTLLKVIDSDFISNFKGTFNKQKLELSYDFYRNIIEKRKQGYDI